MKAKNKIVVRSNLPSLAKYLTANEEKIFMIFDYEQRKPLEQIERELKKEIKKGGSNDKKTTNKGKTL